VSCAVLAAIPGASDAFDGSSSRPGSGNVYANTEPPSMKLMFSTWFETKATGFLLNAPVMAAQPDSVSPLFSSSHRRSLMSASNPQIGFPLSVLLDRSTASGLVVHDAGSFNGSSSVSGGTIYTAFGSQLPFSLLPCAMGQSQESNGAASNCGISARDSSGNDISGVVVSLNQLPLTAMTLPLEAMVFNCDPPSAMQGNCLPGIYNITYSARDHQGLLTMGYVLLVVEQRSVTRLWIAATESCPSGTSSLQDQV